MLRGDMINHSKNKTFVGFHKAPFQGLCGLKGNCILAQRLVIDNIEVLKIFQ